MTKFIPEPISKVCYGLGDYPSEDSYSSSEGRIIIPIAGMDTRALLLSDDNGVTFRREDIEYSRRPPQKFRELSDGSFMALGIMSIYQDFYYDRDADADYPYGLAVYRAKTFDDILNDKVTVDFCPVHIPGLRFGYGDSGNRHTGFITGWRELSNGDILATAYGQLKDDKTVCPYFKDNRDYVFYLYRTWTVVSHDKGKTWEFGCTVADCQTYPLPDNNAEGYCEADVEETEPGKLTCILRSQGHEIFAPMYVCRSEDYGKTWTAPEKMCDWGVLPRILKMKDGTLVCASGHLHTMLIFSDDDGKTWSEPFICEECDGLWGDSATGYTSVYESRPGEITIVYADPKDGIAENAPDGKKRKVYSKTYKINKA